MTSKKRKLKPTVSIVTFCLHHQLCTWLSSRFIPPKCLH